MRYWFSCFFKFTAFLVPSVEPVFVGIHNFLNPPPWIHMIDYICTSQGGKIVVNDNKGEVVFVYHLTSLILGKDAILGKNTYLKRVINI